LKKRKIGISKGGDCPYRKSVVFAQKIFGWRRNRRLDT
jgi:hypothetical protein